MTDVVFNEPRSPSERLERLQVQVASMQRMCDEMRKQLFALSTSVIDLDRELRAAEREQFYVELAQLDQAVTWGGDART